MTRRHPRLVLPLLFLLAAIVLGTLESLQVYLGWRALLRTPTWGQALGSTMPSWIVLALLIPPVGWLYRRFPLERRRLGPTIAVHSLAAVVFVLLHIGGAVLVSDVILGNGPQAMTALQLFVFGYLRCFVSGLAYYFGILGVFHAIAYQRKYREQHVSALRLESALARSRLQLLRLQLQPHFLFNTLNSISALIYSDPDRADAMLVRLSGLLRMTLDESGLEAPLAREVELLEAYLDIERERFQGWLHVHVDIDPAARRALVPTLLIQPIVENAIRHGIAPLERAGTIRVSARRAGGKLELRVEDDGVGPRAPLASLPRGVGLESTTQRLQQLFGSNHEFTLVPRAPTGASVRIRIPFREADPALLEESPAARGDDEPALRGAARAR
jgi:hypothetical protein